MATSTADLLLHPVRLRVVRALAGRRMTTGELRAELPDLPSASLYRHVARLAQAGVLEVVGERRVRGAVERTYALRPAAARIGAEEAAAMSRDEHRRAFAAFVATVLADFDRYLAGARLDLARDGAGYSQAAVWLSDEELHDLSEGLRGLVGPHLANGPAPGRRRRVLTTILTPDPGGPEP